MKLLDLFAGIGGFSLAWHWLGGETSAFVEWDPFNQKVLAKNFPGVPIYSDIREFNAKEYHGTIDIITGGFPCQPFSTAGKREGTNDERYLWPEMLRVIREVQPTYVIGENVAGIYSMDNGRVFEQVCADMENEGYAVQPFCIPACAQGAPHRRDRWWFVAYRNDVLHAGGLDKRRNREASAGSERSNQQQDGRAANWERIWAEFSASGEDAADSNRKRLQGELCGQFRGFFKKDESLKGRESCRRNATNKQWHIHWHEVATRLCRVDNGLPAWVDSHRKNRLKSLGNAIVPQVAYQIMKGLINQT